MRHRRRAARTPLAGTIAAALLLGLTSHATWAVGHASDPSPTPTGKPSPTAVAPDHRAEVLGKDWKTSQDRAWTTTGDADGFHLLVAEQKDGYGWRTAATLSEPGIDTDTWIGNACVTGSGQRAVVAYAPRTFTNKAELMHRGAFTAVVDLVSGKVTKLRTQASLAYFSPGCGTGETAVLSQYANEDKNATRLIEVDAAHGTTAAPLQLDGQITSAVPAGEGRILGADSARIIRIDTKTGRRTPVARTDGIPFQLKPDADGGLVFLDRPPVRPAAKADAPSGAVRRITAAEIDKADAAHTRPATLATGLLTAVDLTASADGTVFITGEATPSGRLPRTVKQPGVPTDARATTRGGSLVTSTIWADGKDSRVRADEALGARSAKIGLKVLGTGKETGFEVRPALPAERAAEGRGLSPALGTGERKPSAKAPAEQLGGSRNEVVESERTCSVPRNDVRKQVMQPKPRQVEWAVDQAVTNNLDKHISRPANWKNLGMAAYKPQDLFPLKKLSGGGRIPAQVMLGITAQESNMWQAARYVVPGVTGNPLIGNYYGIEYASDGQQTDPWSVHWNDADCGYGITQVTDGMRMHGKEKVGEKPLTSLQQEAVALDYTANIAAGVNILVGKWNETRADGLTVNGGDPQYLENWFFALWAYNAGYHKKADAAQNKGKWGVGFTNNPANPLWKANRLPFLENRDGKDDYSHAAHPQDWPYQEKVLGWAARPLEALESPGKMVSGFRAAWWTDTKSRTRVKPPEDLFCSEANDCDPSKIKDDDSNDQGRGACTRADLYCFWNKPAGWKVCLVKQCGFELLRFDSTYKEEPDGDAYPPTCRDDSASNVLVVDNVPNNTATPRCGRRTVSNGTFTFDFGPGMTDHDGSFGWPSKIDTHQLGGGYGGHFYFAHTRLGLPDNAPFQAKGTWTLGQKLNGWARVKVFIPDHGAHTREAKYEIDTGKAKKFRVTQQRIGGSGTWVSLGVFDFAGTPKVSLSTASQYGDGSEDIAWDAVAFEKLPKKPKNVIVAMGDSYSSGEGASASGGGDYYPETDNNGRDEFLRDACHRSKNAWSRQARLPGQSRSIGELADQGGADLDYHFIACSSATTNNILETGRYGEPAQLQQGYLDESTTLVTISIGGNDAGFSDIIKDCFKQADCTGQNAEVRAKIEGDVRRNLVKTLDAIHTAAKNARIVLMGYPPLLEDKAECLSVTVPPGLQFGISARESQWLNGLSDFLAEQMKSAARTSTAGADGKIWFSSPENQFKGKAICGDPESIHGLVTDLTPGDEPMASWGPLNFGISAQSFHPKTGGARLYADALEATFQEMRL
ncbi:GDSL-type esterase/lipase family protein [Streptomyces triculaminicus]|uniref:GDSL-type esterase/lipase family protein n=1 Tax=Streptomyces triculaminicus TaxID=2816232 RepID=UPI0033CE21DA